jgi:hypothetical protein
MARALWTALIGVLLTALGVYWLLNPPTFFSGLCVNQPCSITVIAAAITSAIGVFLILLSWAQHRAASKPQTVTIAIDEQAEKDAAAVSEMNDAVKKGESAEPVVAAIEPTVHDQAVSEVFASMPKGEVKEGAVVEAAPKAPRATKKKAAKKKAVKKAPAKKKAAKKKK